MKHIMSCGDCDLVFDEDKAGIYREVERLSGRPDAVQEFLTCPGCGSDNVGPDDTTTDEDE